MMSGREHNHTSFMATKQAKKSGNSAVVAAGVAAAAAAAGAAYYFYGAKNAKQHRGQAVKWAKDLKRDVVREAKKLDTIDAEVMKNVVNRAARAYQGLRSVDPVAIREAANELKENWRVVARELRAPVARMAKKAVKNAKKSVKKASKKRAS